jgi:hypothetical protein
LVRIHHRRLVSLYAEKGKFSVVFQEFEFEPLAGRQAAAAAAD